MSKMMLFDVDRTAWGFPARPQHLFNRELLAFGRSFTSQASSHTMGTSSDTACPLANAGRQTPAISQINIAALSVAISSTSGESDVEGYDLVVA